MDVVAVAVVESKTALGGQVAASRVVGIGLALPHSLRSENLPDEFQVDTLTRQTKS